MRVAASQGGHFTAADALSVGYSYPAQAYHVERGDWIRVGRGIYRVADWPIDPNADLVRWSMWSRGLGVISHESALAVHDLGDVMPALVHLTVPPSFRGRAAGVVLHRAALPEQDIEEHAGFRVTTVVRSLLDSAASGMEPDRLGQAIDDAVRRGAVRWSVLMHETERVDGAADPIRRVRGQVHA